MSSFCRMHQLCSTQQVKQYSSASYRSLTRSPLRHLHLHFILPNASSTMTRVDDTALLYCSCCTVKATTSLYGVSSHGDAGYALSPTM